MIKKLAIIEEDNTNALDKDENENVKQEEIFEGGENEEEKVETSRDKSETQTDGNLLNKHSDSHKKELPHGATVDVLP